jgi:hypothetical protein
MRFCPATETTDEQTPSQKATNLRAAVDQERESHRRIAAQNVGASGAEPPKLRAK